MTPAHQSHERRWRVLVLVVVVVALVGVVAGTRGTSAPISPLMVPTAQVSAPDAESSAWYCTGQSTASGVAPGFVLLTNTTDEPVAAAVSAESDTGSVQKTTVSVPADGDVVPDVRPPSSGSWLSDIVTVAGGGVAASQIVHGSSGWSVSPCQSTTSANWYFAAGSTAHSDGLYVSLLNPTSTPVVVDLSFTTPTGVVHPINYQGIVLNPDQVVVENVASEVQNTAMVSTTVTARTGRVVASEVQVFSGSVAGLAVVPGASALQGQWFIPQSRETAGAASQIDVYNPGGVPESVTVHLRVASGPLAPLSHTVAPGATWGLETSKQTRIPDNAFYSADVVASGGPGVVVSRTVAASSSAVAPQAGMAAAFEGLSSSSPSDEWIIPAPGTSANQPVSTVTSESMAFFNTSSGTEHFHVVILNGSTPKVLVAGALAPGATAELGAAALTAVGLRPVLVHSSGTMAVSDDIGPAGMVGVVTMPGIPLAAAIGS